MDATKSNNKVRMSHEQRRRRRYALAMTYAVHPNMTMSEVAAMYGVSEKVVGDSCREFGVKKPRPVKNRRRHKPKRVSLVGAECALLYQAGWTMIDIAPKYGISRERVRQLLVKVGVKERHHGAHKDWRKTYRCPQCGSAFKRDTYQTRVSRYCSHECSRAAVRGGQWSTYETVSLKCDGCGETFTRTKHLHSITRNLGAKGVYCSRECYWARKKPRSDK